MWPQLFSGEEGGGLERDEHYIKIYFMQFNKMQFMKPMLCFMVWQMSFFLFGNVGHQDPSRSEANTGGRQITRPALEDTRTPEGEQISGGQHGQQTKAETGLLIKFDSSRQVAG